MSHGPYNPQRDCKDRAAASYPCSLQFSAAPRVLALLLELLVVWAPVARAETFGESVLYSFYSHPDAQTASFLWRA